MLITIQHPFADSRRFCPDSGSLVARPSWPAPQTGQFVRNFGGVVERRLGGLEFWGEDMLCNMSKGLRFESLPHFPGRRDGKIPFEMAFRRLYFDGQAVGKFEIGIATIGRKIDIRGGDAKAFLNHVLSMQAALPARGKGARHPLGHLGKPLVEAFAAATTRTKTASGGPVPHWAVEPGAPIAFIQLGRDESLALPFFTQKTPDVETWGIELSCCLVPYDGTTLRAWVCKLAEGADRTVARALRLSLLRLHAEQECIRLVCMNILSGKVPVASGTQEAELLQAYLNEATRRISRSERTTRRLSAGEETIVEISRSIADGIRPGEYDSLLQLLVRAAMRKNIIDKLAERMRMSTGDQYIVNGPVGAVGRDAHGAVKITNYQQAWTSVQSQVDTSKLPAELDELVSGMKARATTTEQFQALAEVAAAKDAADKKDGQTLLTHLKQAGKWALKVAQDIGKDVAAKVIESALGLQ
jgi:hypothetical protein